MKNPLVSVIILNYNGKEFLEECLNSVLTQSYPAFEIILVDNGSGDGSCEMVENLFPTVKQVRAGTNLGFAGGNNLGVSRAHGEFVILLNNDTRVQDGWMEGLVEAVQGDNVAIASSLVLTEGIPERYYEKNGSINFLGHNIMGVFDRPEDIFYCGGTSLIFRKEVLGIPFDPLYFAYSEDVYLSLRARFMGYAVVHVKRSVVHHAGGGTSKRSRRSPVVMLQERNRILNILLFFSGRTLVKMFPILLGNVVAKCGWAAFPKTGPLPAIVKAYAWIFCHLRLIASKRRELRKEFRCGENEVISRMTARLTNGETAMQRLIDRIAVAYTGFVGLKTIEFSRRIR